MSQKSYITNIKPSQRLNMFNNMHFIVRNVVKMKNEGFQIKINKSSSHFRVDNG